MAKFLIPTLLAIITLMEFASTKRIKDMIYMPLDGTAACFRRHNGTHQFGCSSSRSGSVGVVHLIHGENDVNWLEKNATAGPYMVVIPFSLFKRDVLMRLKNTDNVSGVLLARNTSIDLPTDYSPDDTCPNRYSGYKKCDNSKPWNPYGSALLMEDWPFPMFYTQNDTVLEEIKACYKKHNAHDFATQSERSLCALEMNSFMFAAINSESCLRRSGSVFSSDITPYCDHLGDRNIHWPLAPLKKSNNSVIMVTAKLDAASMFDGLSPGGASTVTGLVTLIATAYYLNNLKPSVEDTNVVFNLFNGEVFDYIGSSRMVYDMKNGTFNTLNGVSLKLEDIRSVIELGQLGNGDIFLHSVNEEQSDIVRELSTVWNATILKNSVPPASVQSFLKEKSNLSALVITNHGEQFVNKYYNSILDNAETLHYNSDDPSTLSSSLSTVAINLAQVLYKNLTGHNAPTGNQSSVEDLISDMLYCYLENANCTLFQAACFPGHKVTDKKLPLYVSVYRSPNPSTTYTGLLFAFLTGDKHPEMSEAECHEKHLLWMGGSNFTGLCVNSSVNYSAAVSPAFVIPEYNMKSGVYSSWTESIWQSMSMRMFLKPSAPTERLSMILGSVVTLVSFIFVWFVNSRADILFSASRTGNC